MNEPELPASLVEGLLRLCQGDFSYRVPRTGKRDREDTAAFFVNAIAEELERILRTSREQEQRLGLLMAQLSEALTHVAQGNFGVQVARDFSGDPGDVVAYLVNNTITELGASMAAANRRAEEDRKRLEQLVEERTAQLAILAATDSLTGTLNRRRFFEIAEEECARSARYDHRLAVAMLDLDHFKKINDGHGHAAGDRALRCAADVLRGMVRRQDHVGRYGGEEFAVIFPETGLDEAVLVVERMRGEIARQELVEGDQRIHLRISAGVAEWRKGERIDAALVRADEALYKAKLQGRDRVVAAR